MPAPCPMIAGARPFVVRRGWSHSPAFTGFIGRYGDQPHQVLVVDHRLAPYLPCQRCPSRWCAVLEPAGVGAVQPLHADRQVRLGRDQQQVVVVVHHAVPNALPSEPPHGGADRREEHRAVGSREARPAGDRSRGDRRGTSIPGDEDAKRAWHEPRLRAAPVTGHRVSGASVKQRGLTPLFSATLSDPNSWPAHRRSLPRPGRHRRPRAARQPGRDRRRRAARRGHRMVAAARAAQPPARARPDHGPPLVPRLRRVLRADPAAHRRGPAGGRPRRPGSPT